MNSYSHLRRYIPLLALGMLILVSLACGGSASTRETRTSTSVDGVSTAPPQATPESVSTALPTNTPEPTYTDPVVLAEVEGVGESVTDNFQWPSCQKAVFYWTAFPNNFGSASLIISLHNEEKLDDVSLVNEFAMDVSSEGISGSALQPLQEGEYYFSTENTDAPWSLRVVCQDGVAPVASGLDLQGRGNVVTDNYELSACRKSVFAWSAEPDDRGTASLIVHLCKAGEDRCTTLINEFGMDSAQTLVGEALQIVSGGVYFVVTSNTSGRPWNVRWECRD